MILGISITVIVMGVAGFLIFNAVSDSGDTLDEALESGEIYFALPAIQTDQPGEVGGCQLRGGRTVGTVSVENSGALTNANIVANTDFVTVTINGESMSFAYAVRTAAAANPASVLPDGIVRAVGMSNTASGTSEAGNSKRIVRGQDAQGTPCLAFG